VPYSHRADVEDVRAIDAQRARDLDAALANVDWTLLPPGVSRTEYAAPSGRLAGLAAGDADAPRIVLVPGVTGSKEDFILMLPLLAASGMRAEAFDLAGQYESWQAGPEHLDPPRTGYDHPLFVDDLRAVIESGTTPVHLAGYSFAGTVVQLLAAAHPELVASLSLVSTPPLAGQVFRGVKALGRASELATPRVGSSLMIWGVRNNLNRAPAHRVAFVRDRFRLTRRASVTDVIGLMMRTPDVGDDIAALAIPKLVVAGAHDLWPIELHRRYAERIAAGMHVTAGGHSPSEDAPVELSRMIVELADRASR
jgi:pimeloyl-ACP methyl ester carboxylesterase